MGATGQADFEAGMSGWTFRPDTDSARPEGPRRVRERTRAPCPLSRTARPKAVRLLTARSGPGGRVTTSHNSTASPGAVQSARALTAAKCAVSAGRRTSSGELLEGGRPLSDPRGDPDQIVRSPRDPTPDRPVCLLRAGRVRQDPRDRGGRVRPRTACAPSRVRARSRPRPTTNAA